jgi:excisionase family DNA binding protein
MSMSKALNQEKWFSLPEAAAQLGVHSTTLRRWADNGEIPHMRTPGGHRRFAQSDLDRFANQQRQGGGGTAVVQLWAQQAMTQTRSEISQPEGKAWLTAVAPDSRSQHRQLGQRLMGLTLQYVAAQSNHHLLLEEARTIGAAYGRLAQTDGLSLADTLSATLFFRDMLVETVLDLSPTAGVQPEDNLRLMRRINEMMNAVHLAIARTYEQGQE